MKSILKSISIKTKPMVLFFLAFFFEKKYLQGRHFENSFAGIRWCFTALWSRKLLRLAPVHPFPVGLQCHLSNSENIHFHPDDLNNFQSPGTYFQNFKGEIYLGKGTYIGPNVGLITANHEFENLDGHGEAKDIVLGEKCWIGMNAVLLPGVVLGPRTIVAAGAVVTKSFIDGSSVIGGVPAVVIKKLP